MSKLTVTDNKCSKSASQQEHDDTKQLPNKNGTGNLTPDMTRFTQTHERKPLQIAQLQSNSLVMKTEKAAGRQLSWTSKWHSKRNQRNKWQSKQLQADSVTHNHKQTKRSKNAHLRIPTQQAQRERKCEVEMHQKHKVTIMRCISGTPKGHPSQTTRQECTAENNNSTKATALTITAQLKTHKARDKHKHKEQKELTRGRCSTR